MTLTRSPSLALLLPILFACGPYRASTDPDAMSEDAHRARAEALHRQASRHQASYDPSGIRRSDTSHGGYEGLAGGAAPDFTHPTPGGQLVDPGAGHIEEARRLRELARQHEGAAGALVAFESIECSAIPATRRAACPLLSHVRSVEPLERGVALDLTEDADRQAVLEHARCHVAFGRRRGREGMDACPLYIDGVRAELSDGRLVLTTDVASVVGDLQRRAAAHVAGEP